MKKRKSKSKKGSTRSPRFSAHGAGLMIEAIQDGVRLVGEAVEATREMIEKESSDIRGVITKGNIEIQREISKIQREISEVRSQMGKLDQKIDQTKQELKTEIQSVLVPVNARLDRHEEEITLLKKAL